MQQSPTLTGVRLRTVDDALTIFHAVAQNMLPMIVRRLDFEERKAIKSGNIYVWEERNASTSRSGLGIERWTDGHQYTPSRVRDEFLLYVCKDIDPAIAGQSLTSAQVEAHRLIKQTYSVYIETSPQRKKWHITAYYTPATLNRLATIDSIPRLARLPVPPNVYSPARATKHLKGKSGDDVNGILPAAPTINHARRASLAVVSNIEGGNLVSRGQSQALTGSTRSRYSHDGPSLIEGPAPGIYSTNSAGHAVHIPRPTTAMDPNASLLLASPGSGRLSANPRRRSSLSQPYPYAVFPESSPYSERSSGSPCGPGQYSGFRAYSPPTMVPLSLLEQSHSQHASHRSPIDDSLLKRLPPSTR